MASTHASCDVNSSSLGQNGRHFAVKILKRIFLDKHVEFRFEFHWSLFVRVQLTISKHWFGQWLGAEQATSHYQNQCWPSSLTHICGTRGWGGWGGGGGVGGWGWVWVGGWGWGGGGWGVGGGGGGGGGGVGVGGGGGGGGVWVNPGSVVTGLLYFSQYSTCLSGTFVLSEQKVTIGRSLWWPLCFSEKTP